ncbi:MAG: hypothetical protein WC977_12020 [Anaerovoracaceae bacterium]|nr:hypothetical protein [Candidatus Omnitrophota bacterium]
MNAHYSPYQCIVRGKPVDVGGWYSRDDGHLLGDDELCVVCGKPCVQYHPETGEPVHVDCYDRYEEARAENDNARREAREDR